MCSHTSWNARDDTARSTRFALHSKMCLEHIENQSSFKSAKRKSANLETSPTSEERRCRTAQMPKGAHAERRDMPDDATTNGDRRTAVRRWRRRNLSVRESS